MSRLALALVLLVAAPAVAAPSYLSIGDVKRATREVTGDPSAIFQIGGELVAVLGPTGLCLVSPDGAERGCAKDATGPFAFAPDGRTLAYVVRGAVFSWDVASGARRRVVRASGVDAIGWSSEGLLVRRRVRGQRVLAVVTAAGERNLGRAELFVAAGPTVVRFLRQQICAPACTPLPDPDPVLRAVISADGSRVLFATDYRVYLRDPTGTVSLVAEAPRVRSLAFSGDGTRYLWASVAGGALQSADEKLPIPPVRHVAFRGDVLLLAGENGASTWDPRSGAPKIVGGISHPDGVTLAADLVAGKLVVLYLRSPASVKITAPYP